MLYRALVANGNISRLLEFVNADLCEKVICSTLPICNNARKPRVIGRTAGVKRCSRRVLVLSVKQFFRTSPN